MTPQFARCFIAASLLAVGSASAQVIIVTSQDRFIEGSTISITDGVETDTGPLRDEAFAGDFGLWNGTLTVPGNMLVSGTQDSQFNGFDTISIDGYTMNLSGGGGPGTSGSGTLTNRCSFSFTVPQNSTYTLNGQFASGPSVVVTLTLVGPGVDLSYDTSSGETITLDNVAGSLPAGDYTFTLDGAGSISYEGPGGNGSGAGGTIPLLTFVVTAGGPSCSADFNNDDAVNSQDFFDFLNAFFMSDPSSDFNHDNVVNSQDFFDFLNAFFLGC